MVKPVSVTRFAGRNLYQQRLPRQPVPPLQQSCELYLHFLEPIVEEDDLNRTKKLVEEFQRAGGVGERLQRGLERKAQTTENWLSEDYMKKHHLSYRCTVLCGSTLGLIMPTMDFRDKKGQLRTAAESISAIVELKTMIDNETLPIEHLKGKPLCMKQYEAVLSSCRIPGLGMDSMEYHSKSSNPPKHVTVVHNGHFFVLDVYHSDGTPLTINQLCVQLEKICSSSPQTNTEPVGILPSEQRDRWAKSYSNLIKDQTNKESLSAIQRSISIISLDKAAPPESDEQSLSVFHQNMHGGGSQSNSGNRWFDKSLQRAAAPPAKRSANLVKRGRKKPQVMQSSMESLPEPQKLQFNLTPELKKDIEEAKQHLDILAQDTEIGHSLFEHFGGDVIKAHKMSPDVFLQMAIQLAFYRTKQRLCSTLGPATLRLFAQGRVGVVNSASPAAASFVKAFDDPKKQNSEKIDLLEKAMKAHKWYTNMVVNGQDIENHFLGLKMQAVEQKIPMPDLFTDVSFAKAFDYELSTSQVATSTGSWGYLFPPHGTWQMAYGIANDYIDIIVTGFKENDGAKAYALSRAMEQALLDMKAMLDQRDEL
ncbi:carnitine O-acetyltransferase-like [Centropristis striata]|uniref:carnitine O-acetyltransferase-like n=1 Tax=Centropristis striata TaxID=184440 RepID=UPI0027E0DF56|nr:carnitine O-acetyltransferase-like [Centropristis striata]